MYSKQFEHLVVSAGHLLRMAVKNSTILGKEAMRYMGEGILVPDKIIYALINEYIDANAKQAALGICFTGFPQTVKQAEILDKTLTQFGSPIKAVINLEISSDEVIRRISGRRICLKCGEHFHMILNPPIDGMNCDKCKFSLETRDDDQPQVVEKKLNEYRKSAKPLLEYYQSQKKLRPVDASLPVPMVFKVLCQTLNA